MTLGVPADGSAGHASSFCVACAIPGMVLLFWVAPYRAETATLDNRYGFQRYRAARCAPMR